METPSEGGGWSAEEVPSERTAGRQQGQLVRAQQEENPGGGGGGGDTGILRREAAPGEPGPGSGPVRMELSEVQASGGRRGLGVGRSSLRGSWVLSREPNRQHGLCSQCTGTPLEGLGRGGSVI